MQLLDAPLAIVDLETTGANASWDRITEIALIEIDGGEISGEWSTLVNPQTAIPPAIQALTGITNDMVADAPTFAELARGLHERLAGRVVVAHNARFDYGFLRQAFEREGIRYAARTLCTVKLSRRLYPGHARHNLDSLIARHGLHCRARHRALGDADAVWQFLRVAAAEHGAAALADAAQRVARQPSLPPNVEREAIDAVPEAPGVYLFYGEGERPLYVGMSNNMRARVLDHFAGATRLAREVRRIDWQRTTGELGARLREAELVKALAPLFNRRRRRTDELARPKTIAWPWRGPVGVVEEDRERDASDVHVVHDWCYLGTAKSESELAELLEGGSRARFDLDQYKILARHLLKGRARVVELAA